MQPVGVGFHTYAAVADMEISDHQSGSQKTRPEAAFHPGRLKQVPGLP